MINLLPPQFKEAYRSQLNQRFIVFFGTAMLFVLLVFVLLQGATFLFLNIQKLALEDQIRALENSEQNRTYQELNKKISDLIQQYRLIAVAQDQLFNAESVLEELVSLTPDSVYLTTLRLDRENRTLSMAGFAPRRADVIEFKGNLEESALFEQVISPLANLVRETDISFTFTVHLP